MHTDISAIRAQSLQTKHTQRSLTTLGGGEHANNNDTGTHTHRGRERAKRRQQHLVWVFDVHTEAQLLQQSTFSLYHLVLQVDVVLIEDQGVNVSETHHQNHQLAPDDITDNMPHLTKTTCKEPTPTPCHVQTANSCCGQDTQPDGIRGYRLDMMHTHMVASQACEERKSRHQYRSMNVAASTDDRCTGTVNTTVGTCPASQLPTGHRDAELARRRLTTHLSAMQ